MKLLLKQGGKAPEAGRTGQDVRDRRQHCGQFHVLPVDPSEDAQQLTLRLRLLSLVTPWANVPHPTMGPETNADLDYAPTVP
eukprot:CAMPEP_0115071670 /NCGR_PEP_ID=MMETSP0227-20121206/13799_1 /TAXON_ID=89957 /ORGANISM="Polarella glacialis, Strain CCMP 1383" /LENGTH=81 /DNA_ID=CAMNT_0002458323 /DNA_START=22 /DNA_END=266 /DNA_ORIENTATION=-